MFSIIIPVYNKENFIKRTLTSVLNQTFDDFEVIIVNDGSTDGSMKVVKEFNDGRIRIISQDNNGVSSARNLGIKHAKNNYIAFIDADDIWQPMFLESINKLIELYPDSGAYYTNYKVGIKREMEINLNTNAEYESLLINDYFEFATNSRAICASCVVIKKRVLVDVGGFCTSYRRGEDLYLWSKIALKYKIAYTTYVGAFYYRDVPNSLSRMKFNVEESFSNIAEEFFMNNKKLAINEDSFREYMISIISSKAKYLLIMNKKEEARLLLKKYIKTKNNKKKVYLLYLMSYLPKSFIDILI
ncbi:glycosyltransferase family 2 protein [Peribacillus butanolivorans]|uniref:glycosyltransferase family 2 protein n=1 Tax=Peribacillus butanolivorans TaxID=421767 RepID=UPI003626F7F2